MKLSKEDANMSKRYENSQNMLERAQKSIPLGAQTYSKSITQFPFGASPYFASHGEGAYLYDIDGNKYIDFINAQAAITLGYNDNDINNAVIKQLQKGSIFSLSNEIETEVAEKIIQMVPCAEMVRFGKNGSDATAGAIRLARAYTNRQYVAVCGYHGWQDWYIGSTTKDLGVPEKVKELTLKFTYNDLSSLEKLFNEYPNQIAGVILEPMNVEFPKEGFLEGVKKITHDKGAILIFDEMITGFRFANGGAQEYFNVIPDLSTFGKGVSNGYPLSVIAGKKEIMTLMEDIFFSFTYGGETLSLAASLATLNKLQEKNVVTFLKEKGDFIIDSISKIISKYNLQEIISISGHPSWSFLLFKDTDKYSSFEIKTFYMQEMFKRGILAYGTHNVTYAHSKEDLIQLIKASEEVFWKLSENIRNESLLDDLECKPLEPLFKVRG